MAVLDIVIYPDAPLCEKAAPVDRIDKSIATLARDMLETMFAYDGVGLAAPQVGLSKRLFVLCPPEGEPRCVVNPEVEPFGGIETGDEGCLSLPEVYAPVPRSAGVHVRGYDETGKRLAFTAEGFVARIFQHENDHLDGRVFPDRLDILSREDKLAEFAEKRKLIDAAMRA